MKIAFVKDVVYPWRAGGAQKRNWEVARRLADRHDVHLYGMKYWDGPSTIERDGVTIHGICEARDLHVNGRRSIPQALYFTRNLILPMLRADVDVIDCQKSTLFPFFAAKGNQVVKRSALVGMWTEVWGDYWYEYLGRKGFFGVAVERAAVKMPDYVIAISEYMERELRTIGRTKNVEVVHNGVDYQWIEDIPAADASWDAIYVGRLIDHKNVDVILAAVSEATEQLEDPVSCAIIGTGPQREELEQYADDLGLSEQVEFLGFVEDDEDVMANLKAAKVFVLPSQQEGFSNTLLEANACGVPSIVTDEENSGNGAIVEDGETGFVVEPSVEAVSDRLVDVLEDPSLQIRLSEGAAAFGADHDWAVIVEQTEAVYRKAYEGR